MVKQSMSDSARVGDILVPGRDFEAEDFLSMKGMVLIAVQRASGELECQIVRNLITEVGDEYYGERAAGISSPPAQVAGMKLGTGSTAVAKTGAGAALDTYLSGSNKAIDGSFPTSSLAGSARQIQWKTSWGAGVVNGSALREVVIVNDNVDATSTAANTYSRALFGPMTLGALDTIAITWNHLLEGS